MRQRIPFRRIDVAEFETLRRNDALLLDVRNARSFHEGHIDGALHVSHANVSALIEGTSRDRPVLIYCYHGNASQEFGQLFSDFGFREVCSLDGGIEAWRHHHARAATPIDAPLAHWLSAYGFPCDDINAVIANETTPLMKAAHIGNVEIVRLLVKHGAQLDARNADGNNALWLACVGRHLDVIDLLVDSGIDMDNRNDNGATPLMYAASSGIADVVAHLLAKGADTAPETLDGFTALDLAGTIECLTLLRRASCARTPLSFQGGSSTSCDQTRSLKMGEHLGIPHSNWSG